MEGSVSSSASTVNIHRHFQQHFIDVSDSPHSSALPSPPDSPLSGSGSSFPSVSSSFFFSSAAASPPHPHSQHLDSLRELTEGLIIPSLTLPSALRRPSAYGQAIGDLRILVLGNHGAGKAFLPSLLLEDNDAVVEVGAWEETEYGKVLYASTDWIEHKDAHGLEKYEPTRNIEIVELPSYDSSIDGGEITRNVLSIINSPFHSLSEVLHPDNNPSSMITSLLSSNSTPLFTAMIFWLPSGLTSFDREIINELGVHIPLILLPSLPSRHNEISLLEKLSTFRPSTAVALRSGLFNSPETLALLRSEAADRFLRWREVERTISIIKHSSYHTQSKNSQWDKQKWEAQYLTSLSHDVAKRARELSLSSSLLPIPQNRSKLESTLHEPCSPLDPLHLPSLLLFSMSLLSPLRVRLRHCFNELLESISSERNVKFALIGGFFIGLGFGVLIKS